jgi:hypothetical protein
VESFSYNFFMLVLLGALMGIGAQAMVSESNFREWLTFIQPTSEEQKYKEIGWRNEFWPAVEEARQLGRPILFWTMNGHPLGCT